MTQRFDYLKFYNLKESILLIGSLVIDWIYKKIPRRIFLIKNTYNVLRLRKAHVRREKNEMIVNLDSVCYCLRLFGSDLEVFGQIILHEELRPLITLASQLQKKQLHIVDCGANIGLSSLFFKKHFPDSKIICIEPEPSNYLQLCKNLDCNKLTDVHPIQGGIWYEETMLAPDRTFRDRSDWSFAVKETNDASAKNIKVDSLSNIAAKQNWKNVDLLKIDIEGSEFELFRNIDRWKSIFETVKIVSVEVHPEKGPIDEIEGILQNHGFRLRTFGVLLVGIKDNLLMASLS